MRGELSSGRFAKRHPYDWYVDEQWVAAQLVRYLGNFEEERSEGLAIWDPCCGYGNTAVELHSRGLQYFLSDVVDHVNFTQFAPELARPHFFSADFLECDEAPAPCSIVCNPPYSYKKGILEAFVRHALRLATGRVCMVVPNKWLSSQVRYRLFTQDHPPALILHLTQRPSMPPGDRIKLMGNRAFRGGMIDYCWVVWDVRRPTAPGQTRTVWLPPLGEVTAIAPIPPSPIERLVRLAADLFNVSAELIRSESRSSPVVRARFAVYWGAHHGSGLSVTRVARMLGGRDHCTVTHGLRRAERLRASDSAFRTLSDRLKAAALKEC